VFILLTICKEKVMKNFLGTLKKRVTGATAIEYALIVSLIAVVIIAALTALGVNLSGTFDYVAGCLGPLGCPPPS
jgi:pilus assembly protein Flp/PilA